jgi:hypothetical protein
MTPLNGDLELPSHTVPAYCANQRPKKAQVMTASDVAAAGLDGAATITK